MNSQKLNWPNDLVVYQIYPRSFMDTSGDGVGDLKGIESKLDYLKDLGVNAIWLSPIYKSPMVDFGYDILDYKNIDPIFGHLKDFDQLVKLVHKKGLNILMDYVPNHTSSLHPWFLESRSSKDNPKRDWYVWKEAKSKGREPNNWLSTFGGSTWEWDEKTQEYYLHSFDKEQPDLNWRNPQVVKEMKNVLRFWLDRGVDGFRVDVPEWMFKDPQFRDEPLNPYYQEGNDPYSKLLHKYTFGFPESTEMVEQFVRVLEEYERKFLVTEIWSPMESLLKMYRRIDRKYFTPFNFSLISLPWSGSAHRGFVDEFDKEVGNIYLPNYVLGSHDKSRVATRIGKNQARIAAMLLLTLRGIPFIYYGEEIGMEDTKIPPDQVKDPYEKKTPGLGLGRDPQRSPMQWNSSKNAGFTKGKPWLPINKNFKKINVEEELKDDNSMLNFYKQLIKQKNNSDVLLLGSYSSWNSGNENVFCYTRQYKKESFLIALNYSPRSQAIEIPFEKGEIILSTYMDHSKQNVRFENFKMRPDEGIIFKLLAS